MIPPASRSPEEFPVQQSQAKDIIRVASYHRKDFDHAVIRLDLRETDPHRRSLVAPFAHSPETGLGDLEPLPLEILCEICRLLDVASLFSLGQVSRRGRQVVAALPGYATFAKYALDALRVVFKAGLKSHFTAADLHNILCTRDCALCGEFGGFVFLPVLRRCCFDCIQFNPENQVVTLGDVRAQMAVTETQLKKLNAPILRTLPGVYSMDETQWKRRLRLVSPEVVPGSWDPTRPVGFHLAPPKLPPLHRFLAATALPFVDPVTFEVQHGVSCKGCQIVVEKDSMELKSLDNHLRDRVYSEEGFIDHFKWCAEAQTLWVSSQGGTVPVKESSFIRRGGYLRNLDDGITS